VSIRRLRVAISTGRIESWRPIIDAGRPRRWGLSARSSRVTSEQTLRSPGESDAGKAALSEVTTATPDEKRRFL
jgi:hypothetical protein